LPDRDQNVFVFIEQVRQIRIATQHEITQLLAADFIRRTDQTSDTKAPFLLDHVDAGTGMPTGSEQ
jgi:hypothetical protein